MTKLRQNSFRVVPPEAATAGSSLEFGQRPSIGIRLGSAVRRRARYAWKRLLGRTDQPLVATAYDRLLAVAREGVPLLVGDALPCPGATGAAIATAVAYGDDASARRWAKWLLATQDAAGAFPDGSTATRSLLNSGHAVRGLLALHEVQRDETLPISAAIQRGCEYLLSAFDQHGCLRRDDAGASLLSVWAPPALQLSCLSPVVQAARRFNRSDWTDLVRVVARRFRRRENLARWDGVSHLFAAGINGMIDLAEIEPGLLPMAGAALSLATGAQRRDGGVPALPRQRWCSAAGNAWLAVAWQRQGEHLRAGLAWDALAARQLPTGGFPGSWGQDARYFPRREVTWATIGFLDATLLRVAAAFSADEAAWPDIDLRDPRLETVLRWADQLPHGAILADLGCGHGRYLRQIGQRRPDLKLVGVDVSPRLLRSLSDNIAGRQGSLLRIPAADGEFDAVLAIESLEHSLLPRRAIQEMCRVTRPGGNLLVIDKDIAAQPLSAHLPWEQWFSPSQLSGWLCEKNAAVAVARISSSRQWGPGVFLAWTATMPGRLQERLVA